MQEIIKISDIKRDICDKINLIEQIAGLNIVSGVNSNYIFTESLYGMTPESV